MKYTREALKLWADKHKVATLGGANGQIGLAISYGDFLSDNNRRHLTVVGKDLDSMVERFCSMHSLPLPVV